MDWVWATLPLVADMVNLKVVFEWGLGQGKNPLLTLPSPPSLLPFSRPDVTKSAPENENSNL